MVGCLRGSLLRASDKREIVVGVAGVFVTLERLLKMIGGYFILAAAVIRKTQGNMRWGKTRIAFERLLISRARFSLFALLIESNTLDITLLRTRGDLRVGNGARCRFEIGIGVDGRVRAVLNQGPSIFTLETNAQRLTNRPGWQFNCGREGFCRIKIDTIVAQARAIALHGELNVTETRVGICGDQGAIALHVDAQSGIARRFVPAAAKPVHSEPILEEMLDAVRGNKLMLHLSFEATTLKLDVLPAAIG